MICPLSETIAVFSGESCVFLPILHVSDLEDKEKSH